MIPTIAPVAIGLQRSVVNRLTVEANEKSVEGADRKASELVPFFNAIKPIASNTRRVKAREPEYPM